MIADCPIPNGAHTAVQRPTTIQRGHMLSAQGAEDG